MNKLRHERWSSEELIFSAKSYFSALLGDIQQAKEEIILEVYIFQLDATGQQILDALKAAAERGVRVKLLIDGMGSSEHADAIASFLTHPKAEVRIYHPLPWNFLAYRWAMKRQNVLVKLWRFITEVNHRDHRKLCIIDEEIAWLGSFNITDEHIHHNWHDSAVRLSGEPILHLKNNFFHIWQQRQKSTQRDIKQFLSNHSIKLRKQKNAELIRIIEHAHTRICITNAYFAPSNPLIKVLKKAVKRGVSVQVIVPSRSDILLFPAITRSFYADLLAAKLRIYEYKSRILHSKTMLVDNQLIIGSTNLNARSYFHDLELDAILENPETVITMENKFREDLANSEEITLRLMQRFSIFILLFAWFSRLLRYWI